MVFRLGNFTEYYIKAENAIAYALRMKEATVAGGGLYLEVAVLDRITTWSLTLIREGLAPTYFTYTLVAPKSGLPIMKMNCTCVMLFLAICALWTFGETLSCDQCGRECADICGTRQFRACCFNNMKKRQYNVGLKLWMRPRRHRMHLYPVYDMQ